MIFFDFDGTVASVWTRYYQVFCEASGIHGISQVDYIWAKRTLVLDQSVARFFNAELPVGYFEKKKKLLEDTTYLKLDSLLLPSKDLEAFFCHNKCCFLTNRRHPERFLAELDALGLGKLSDHAIILNPDTGVSKKMFLEKNFPQSFHIIIGDSKAEWEAAALENVQTILVRTGLRRPEDFPLKANCTVMTSIVEFMAAYVQQA